MDECSKPLKGFIRIKMGILSTQRNRDDWRIEKKVQSESERSEGDKTAQKQSPLGHTALSSPPLPRLEGARCEAWYVIKIMVN